MLVPAGGALMAARAVGRLSWVVVPLALLGYALYLVLGLSNPAVNGPAAFGLDDALWVLGQATFAIVGAVVASKRPELPIGWLYCVAGLFVMKGEIDRCIDVHDLADGSRFALGSAAAWLSEVNWYANLALLGGKSLMFPSGRPPSHSWSAVA